MKCDCRQQFDEALIQINSRGSGIVLYVDGHEGRGIGLSNKLKAYELQRTKGLDTFQANEALGHPTDARKYDTPIAILHHLQVKKIELMTSNPHKIEAFKDFTSISSPINIPHTKHNKGYLLSKEKAYGSSSITTTPTSSSSPQIISLPSSIIERAVVPGSTSAHSSTFHKTVPIALPSPDNVGNLKIAIVRTCWNEDLVGLLSSQCRSELLRFGAKEENIGEDILVPGSYELPYIAQAIAESGEVDAVIAIGVLIKGETMHFDFISASVAQGLMQVQLTSRIPVIYSVLNCLTLDQAIARCGTESPLPSSLAASAIRMAHLKTAYKSRIPSLLDQQTYSLLAPCSKN